MIKVNKRGQSETSGVVIWLLVALIAAGIVAYFVWGGFGSVSDIFDYANVDTTAITTKCNALTTLAYCTDTIELDDKHFVTCGYAEEMYYIEVEDAPTCSYQSLIGICNRIKDNVGSSFDNSKYEVDGVSCQYILDENGLKKDFTDLSKTIDFQSSSDSLASKFTAYKNAQTNPNA